MTTTAFGLTDLALLGMAVIWGVNVSIVKYATHHLPPLAFNGPRVLIAALCLLGIAAAAREAWPSRRDALALLALGAIGNGVYQIFFIEGLARTRAGSAALVLAATPAFVALIGRARGVERISRRGAAGIAASFVGIALVIAGTGPSTGENTLLGSLLVLGGTLAWSIFTVLGKPYNNRVSPLPLAAITMTGGAIVLLAFAAPSIAVAPWGSVPLRVWVALVYSSVGALVVAYLFWHRGVRLLGPTRAAMYGNLQPVIALAFAWAMLGETPTVPQVAGAAGILYGLLLTRA